MRYTVIFYPQQQVGKEFTHSAGGTQVRTDGNAYQGWFDVREATTMAQLAQQLDDLTLNELFVHGVPVWQDAKEGFVTADGVQVPSYVDPASTYIIARTKDDLCEPTEAVCTLDSDFDWAPDWTQHIRTPEQHWSFLSGVVPELAGAGVVVRPSSSAYITNADGTPYKGTTNFHTHFACHGDERAAILDRLHDLFAVRGYAWIILSTAGGMLKRSPADLALRTPNQPVYAAKPRVVEPITSSRPAPFVCEGRVLRLADLPAPDPAAVKAAWEALQSDPTLLEQQAQVKEAYIAERAGKALALVRNPTPAQVDEAKDVERKRMAIAERARLHGESLPPEYVISTIAYGNLTVAELLANPKRYHEAKTRDPVEPEYRGGAQTGILYLKGRVPVCVSLAHGMSITYRLEGYNPDLDWMRENVQRLLGQQGKAVDGEVMPEAMTPQGAKAKLVQHIENFMVYGGKVGIAGEAGLGKSYEVATALVLYRNGYNLVLSPSTQRGKEFYQTYIKAGGDPAAAHVYLGRGQPDPDAPGMAMCTRPHHAAHNLHFGVKGTSLCKGCPLWSKRQCGYDRQRETIDHQQPRTIFASHEMAYVPISGWEPTRVFIDETLRNGGVEMSISTPALTLLGLPNEPTPEQVQQRLDAHADTLPTAGDFDEAVAHKRHALVLEALRDGVQVVRANGQVTVAQKLPYLYPDVDTLVIDASLDPLLTELYLGPLDTVHKLPVRANHHVTQVVGHQMGIKTITSKPELLNQLATIVEQYDGKIVEKQVRAKLNKLGDNTYGHFRNIRGLNLWANASTLIVVGYCSPNLQALEAIAAVLTEGPVTGKQVKETVYIRRSDPSQKPYPTEVHNHTNEVVQALLRSSREEELYQAIYRARQLWHDGEPKRIVLVSPVATRVAVDEVIEWSNFKQGRAKHRLAEAISREGGIMELGAAALAKAHPDLFGSKDTAKRDLQAAKAGEMPEIAVLGTGKRQVLRLGLAAKGAK